MIETELGTVVYPTFKNDEYKGTFVIDSPALVKIKSRKIWDELAATLADTVETFMSALAPKPAYRRVL